MCISNASSDQKLAFIDKYYIVLWSNKPTKVERSFQKYSANTIMMKESANAGQEGLE